MVKQLLEENSPNLPDDKASVQNIGVTIPCKWSFVKTSDFHLKLAFLLPSMKDQVKKRDLCWIGCFCWFSGDFHLKTIAFHGKTANFHENRKLGFRVITKYRSFLTKDQTSPTRACAKHVYLPIWSVWLHPKPKRRFVSKMFVFSIIRVMWSSCECPSQNDIVHDTDAVLQLNLTND